MKQLTTVSALFLLASIIVNVAGITMRSAQATIPVKPYTFTPNTLIQSSQINSDFDTLYSAFSTIDNTNISATGIYASQVVPDTTTHATFGGSVLYTFPHGVVSSVPVSPCSSTSGFPCSLGGNCTMSASTTCSVTLLSVLPPNSAAHCTGSIYSGADTYYAPKVSIGGSQNATVNFAITATTSNSDTVNVSGICT